MNLWYNSLENDHLRQAFEEVGMTTSWSDFRKRMDSHDSSRALVLPGEESVTTQNGLAASIDDRLG